MASLRAPIVALFLAILLIPFHALANDDEEEMYSIAKTTQIAAISDFDLGLNAAQLRPQGDQILIVGAEGYARLIDSEEPDLRGKDISLTSGKSEDFTALGWHPQGQSALLVGENGQVMRLSLENYALETVEGKGLLEGEKQTAINWNRNGDVAYLGGENGSIFRYSSADGFTYLDKSSSPVTAIDCHPSPSTRLCVVTTAGDGVAVIDNDHQLSWISNTEGDTWIDVVCPTVLRDVCILIGSGKRLAILHLDIEKPSASATDNPEVLSALEGELTGGSLMGDGSISLHIAPYSIASYGLEEEMAWAVVLKSDVSGEGSLAGSTMVFTWGSEDTDGFVLSSNGLIASISPLKEVEERDLLGMVVMGMVAISVPGVLFGMIFMNSKTLQRWWADMSRKRRQKKFDRIQAKQDADDSGD
ncbi:MAG: hypothetical protein HN696_03770 [Euryarchaeota archaeon]|nr:hypothetical protein [Euryarchaeota archaeon]